MSEAKCRLLLVDDDGDILRILALRLRGDGFEVETADSGESALSRVVMFRPQVVVTDLCMGGMDGMALSDALHAQFPTLPIIIMTGHGTISDAVAATKRGAFGFISKPVDKDELVRQVNEALRVSPPQSGKITGTLRIVTQSPKMEELLNQARLVAQTKASVLIRGESGTGKELLARVIHEASMRRDRPFVAINCSAVPEKLFESELFGHKKGAFSDANRDHMGLFMAADGGTLFLDEIGDMPKPVQVKLLRALQEKQVRPVGGTRDEPVDVRIISATHVDLEEAIAAGSFREDLFYRLNVVSCVLPSLSERPEDIPLLVNHFLDELSASYGEGAKRLDPEALELLMGARWPGNIRQLRNVLEQCVALCGGATIPASLVQRALKEEPVAFHSLNDARDIFERKFISRLLESTQGNVAEAAKLAKRNRTEFYKLLKRHGINPQSFKENVP